MFFGGCGGSRQPSQYEQLFRPNRQKTLSNLLSRTDSLDQPKFDQALMVTRWPMTLLSFTRNTMS